MNNLNITELLKKRQQPIATQFLQTKKVDPIKDLLIKPEKLVSEFDEKGKEKIELWLSVACIATTILDTSTKALVNLKVINSRHAVFDLINGFKGLKKYFSGNVNHDAKEREIDDFVFNFLTSDEEHQKRVMRFQESLMNKSK